MADRQGFEPWVGYKPTPVFKTGTFNHSAICPAFLRLRASFFKPKSISMSIANTQKTKESGKCLYLSS